MKRAAKKAQIEREVYFDNLHWQNARIDIWREADTKGLTEGLARWIATAALLLGLLLMAPGVLKIFGFPEDSEISAPGFGLCDWLFSAGLLIEAGAFAWIGCGDELIGWAGKRNARQKADAEKRKNTGRTGGGANGGRK
jgi:hypothetical protein